MSAIDKATESWTFTATPYSGADRRGWHQDALHFLVGIEAKPDLVWQGPYSVGQGVVILAAQDAVRAGARIGPLGQSVRPRDVLDLAIAQPRTLHVEETLAHLRAWYRPSMRAVVVALLHDAGAMSGWDTFRDWLDETGMDFDSPADALEAFEGCRDAARFLHLALGSAFEACQEEAQDE
jgi:hypothetical protein